MLARRGSKIGPAKALPLTRSRSDSGDSGRVRSRFSTTRCNDLAFQIASCVSQLAPSRGRRPPLLCTFVLLRHQHLPLFGARQKRPAKISRPEYRAQRVV